jgi:hypothetical protein
MGRARMLESVGREGRRSRLVAFATVMSLHLVLLQIAYRVTHRLRESDATGDALVLLRLDRPPQPRPADERAVSRPASSTRSPAPIREESPPEPTVRPQPPHPIDWRANAARSAQLTVEGAQAEKHLSFAPRKEPPRDEPAPPSIFREVPNPEYGDVGEVDGRPVVWMNENCYTELDRSVQTARDAVIANPGTFTKPAINCVEDENGGFHLVQPNPTSFTPWSLNYSRALGKREADGTLFEHIKKPEEPPVPKAGTEMNELPERKQEAPGTTR